MTQGIFLEYSAPYRVERFPCLLFDKKQTVSDIESDMSGNVWLATAGGLDLLSFDGSAPDRYSVKRINDTHRGGNDWHKMEQICFDANNGIWVGTKAGIRFYDPAADRFKSYPQIEKEFEGCNFVRAIYRDNKNGMWVGFNSGGLFRYDHKSGQVHQIDSLSNGYTIDNCTAICSSDDDRIWVGTKDNGIFLIEKTVSGYDGKSYAMETGGLPPCRVSYIYTDSFNNVWCGTETGLYRYMESSDNFAKFVCLDLSEADAVFSDNYFDLCGGEEKTVSVIRTNKDIDIDAFKNQLTVTSLYDTY